MMRVEAVDDGYGVKTRDTMKFFLSINYIRDYIRMQLNNGTGIQNGQASSFATLVDMPLGKNKGAVLGDKVTEHTCEYTTVKSLQIDWQQKNINIFLEFDSSIAVATVEIK